MNKRAYQLYSYVCLIVIYLALTFLVAPDPAILQHYHLSVTHYRVILATVAVPLVIIWLIAFYGFTKLQAYADTIKSNKDGKYVTKLTWGVTFLVFQLPIVSVCGDLLNNIGQDHSRLEPTTTIIAHYVRLVLPLVAFLFISYGARGLTEIVKRRPTQRATHILALSIIVIGAGFTYFAFHGLSVSPANQAQYYLPNWLVFFTLVVPYIYTWFIGLLAAYEVYLFHKKVPGILYRRGWELLAGGIGWIILISILYQYLTILSSHLTRLKVNALLLVVYAAIVLLAVGYILVAAGARKLQKIEEV